MPGGTIAKRGGDTDNGRPDEDDDGALQRIATLAVAPYRYAY